MKVSQGQCAGGWRCFKGRVLECEGVLRVSLLEDEGFTVAYCWRMKGLTGSVLED